MSLPRFLVAELPLTGRIALDAQESRHASQVLRLKAGDSVEIFDGRGGSARAEVVEAGRRETVVEFSNRTDVDRELKFSLELIIALPKGDRQKQLVEALVQLGVQKLTPLSTERSVAQPTGGAIERLERAVIESSKQCGRNRLMEIGQPLHLHELLATTPPQITNIFAHPYGQAGSLAEIEVASTGGGTSESSAGDKRCARAVIGPEGGLTAVEVEELQATGWQQVLLGPRILRVETAAAVIAAWWSIRQTGGLQC